MKAMFEKIANVIKSIAKTGAGAVSSGVAYEPKLPKCLKK